MANKFSIVIDPTFEASVKIPSPGREPVEVGFTFYAKDRIEVAEFEDARSDFFKKCLESAESESWGNSKWQTEISEFEFGQLKSIVANWDMDEPFDDKNLTAFVRSNKERPAAVVLAFLEANAKAVKGN